MDVRQTDHSGAEPAVAVGVLGSIENLEQRFLRRLEGQLPAQLGIDLLQPAGSVAGHDLVALAVVADQEVGRFERLIAGEHFEHFERIAHANVERIGVEGVGQHFLALGLVPQPHQDHSPFAAGGAELRHSLQGRAIVVGRGRIALQPVERVGQCDVKLAGVRVGRVHLGDQLDQPALGPGGAVGRRPAVERPVDGRQSAQQGFALRIQRPGLLQRFQGFVELGVGQIDVGPGQMGRQLPRIDLQRPIERRLGFAQLIVLHRLRGERGMNRSRVGIQGQGRLELAAGVGLVVLFQKQQAHLQVGRPIIGRLLQNVGIQLVDQKVELIADPIPAGKLGRRQADAVQRIRILQLVAVVIVDQPFVGRVGRRQIAPHAQQLGGQPAGGQQIAVALQGLLDRFVGRGVIAPLELQPRQLRRQPGQFGRRLEGLLQRLLGRFAVTGRRLCPGNAERRGFRLLARKLAKRFERFLVARPAAAAFRPPRCPRVPRRRRGSQAAQPRPGPKPRRRQDDGRDRPQTWTKTRKLSWRPGGLLRSASRMTARVYRIAPGGLLQAAACGRPGPDTAFASGSARRARA